MNTRVDVSKILIVGYLVPDDVITKICSEDVFAPMQTHRFAWGIITGIAGASPDKIDVCSFLPVNDYPQSPRQMVGYSRWRHQLFGSWVSLPFINIFPLKHATRFAAAFCACFAWNVRYAPRRRCVLNFSGATPQLLAVRLATWLTGARMVNFLNDPPSADLSVDNPLKRALRRADRLLARMVLPSTNGIVAVARQLAIEVAPKLPRLVVDGTVVTSDEPRSPVQRTSESRFVVAYAGTLGEVYGIPALLGAYRILDPQRHVLWVFGKGDYEQTVMHESERNPAVRYFGYVVAGLDEHLALADLLVMVRPAKGADAAFVFPSKIHSYMGLGVPTAATLLEGIEKEYFDYLYPIADETPAGIAACIEAISAVPREQRSRRALAGKAFMQATRSPAAQGLKVCAFINSLR